MEKEKIFENSFVLLSVQMKIIDTNTLCGVSVIDSVKNSIKLTEFIENDYYTNIENILIKLAPVNEEYKFIVLAKFPMSLLETKFRNLCEKFEFIDYLEILENKKKNENFEEFLSLGLTKKDERNSILVNNENTLALESLGNALIYSKITENVGFHYKFNLGKLNVSEFMGLDYNCIQCLNLFDDFGTEGSLSSVSKAAIERGNDRSSGLKTSVYGLLNQCCTRFGSRLLRSWLSHPLQDIRLIEYRLNMVELFLDTNHIKTEIRDSYLRHFSDIQSTLFKLSKYISKEQNDISLLTIGDCFKLKTSLQISFNLLRYLKLYEGIHEELFKNTLINDLNEILGNLKKLEEFLERAIYFNQALREHQISPNISEELTSLKKNIDESWSEIEEVKTEILGYLTENGFKSKHVKIEEYALQGYCFELMKKEGDSFLKDNPDYKRVTTNKNYIIVNSKKLQRLSEEIKRNKDDFSKEERIYVKKLYDVVVTYYPFIEQLISVLAELDVLTTFATLIHSAKYPYCKPILSKEKKLVLKASRHFLLEWNEGVIPTTNPTNSIVSNDCLMTADELIHVITGVNMGGKTTYIRQIGLCVLLAHIGFYVPANEAIIPLTDQILTRVGASDNMLKGASTFMNEMLELASLINTATDRSLIIIDEMGRGTASDGGIALSSSILEYISDSLHSFCLFATHYHEVTALRIPTLRNYHVDYSVQGHQLLMNYKVKPGFINKSYGVNLFRALDFKKEIIEYAENLL